MAGWAPARTLRLAHGRWGTLARAAVELGLARLRLDRDAARQVRRDPADPPSLTRAQARLVEDVAFTIPRVAARVPWRADCLVQAMAAERWLRRRGIAARIVIGVRPDGVPPLDAHAWLRVGDRIVTGGDIAAYIPFAD